jgi:hypothetical protein
MADKEFDIKKFLAGLDLNESERQAAEAIFTKEKNVAEIKRGWNSVSEGSRLVDEAKSLKTQAEADRAVVAAEKAEAERIRQEATAETEKNRTWAQALKTYEADSQQTQLEREEFAAKNAAYEAYLKELGYNDTTAILAGRMPALRQPAPPPPPPASRVPSNEAPPAPGMDTKFIERYEAFESQAGKAVGLLANLPFEIDELQSTHADLYGKRIPGAKLMELRGKYLDPQNTRSLMDLAREDLHFADREKELQEQAITERANQMAQEMYQKRMDDLHLPSAVLERAESAPIVQFHSKEFTENGSRAGDLAQGNVDQKQLDAFMTVDAELAAQGIRPSTL